MSSFGSGRINRIGGFPHSEIVGSKLAHSSPTLIAACHVLHRLYMPRHPRIALTSRLRVHTTNDNTGSTPIGRRHETRQSSAAWFYQASLAERPLGADDYNLSQIVGYASPPNACASSVSRNPLVIEADLERRSFAPALRPTLTVVRPNRHHHGIDFKNPFTMSKRR